MVDDFGEEIPADIAAPTALAEAAKPTPRPYIRRTRSSSSTVSVDSQGSGGGPSPIERSQSVPGSATASPISPIAPRLLGRRPSNGSIAEANETTS